MVSLGIENCTLGAGSRGGSAGTGEGTTAGFGRQRSFPAALASRAGSVTTATFLSGPEAGMRRRHATGVSGRIASVFRKLRARARTWVKSRCTTYGISGSHRRRYSRDAALLHWRSGAPTNSARYSPLWHINAAVLALDSVDTIGWTLEGRDFDPRKSELVSQCELHDSRGLGETVLAENRRAVVAAL